VNVDEFFARLMHSNLKDIKKAIPYFTADLALLILKLFQLSLDRMEERCSDALAILQDALDRCRTEDMRTPEVLGALDFLEATKAQGFICLPGASIAESKLGQDYR